MITSKRNGKIEFWRFIFSIIIVIHHSRYLLGDKNCMFLGGSFAVEFFFIVSGYLMMTTIEKKQISSNKETQPILLGKETLSFLWRKVKVLYPDILIAWIISVLFIAFANRKSLFGTIVLFIDSFFEAILIKMSGIYSISVNGVIWYISSMLLCMFILYPLIRKYPDITTNILIPISILLILGYLSGEHEAPRNPTKWIGLTYKGNLRAFAEIGLGILAYKITKHFSTLKLTRIGQIFLSLIEWGFYIILILYMYTQKASVRDYFFLLIMVLAVSLSFSKKGIDADWFDKKLFYWLGRYSLPLYLAHTYYAQHLNKILPVQWNSNQRMALYMILSIFTSFIIWSISIIITKYLTDCKKILCTLLIQDKG